MNNIIKKQIEKYIPYNEQEENDKEIMLKYIDTFEDVVTRENKMCHFTASNWIVNKEKTKVLMIYHNIYKSWAWTGGHVDGDSDLLHVALKEAGEETGLKNIKVLSDGIYGIQILTVDSHIKRGKFVPSHLHLDCCFLLEADESEVLKIKADENSGVKWIDIDKAIEVTNEEKMKPIYRKLNEKIEKYKEN
jgi:ADP-ribose pyrophosphatase YjhB (NUDIX family)